MGVHTGNICKGVVRVEGAPLAVLRFPKVAKPNCKNLFIEVREANMNNSCLNILRLAATS